MSSTEEGREVPSITRMVQIPAGKRAVAVVKSRQSALRNAESVHLSIDLDETDEGQLTAMTLDPPAPVTIGGAVEMRGRLLSPLTIYPYQIDAADEGQLVENSAIEFEVRFEPDPSAMSITPVNDPPGSDMAVMFDRITLNGPSRDDPVYAETQLPNRGRILILHQVDQMFNDQGRPLVEELARWKRRMGYDVEVLGVDVAHGVTPVDIRANILRPRYRDIDNPLTYVIIIGGDVPNQNLYFPSFRSGGGEVGYIGDHYYTLMDDDNVYLSDIAIGRLQVQSFQELAGVVTRGILYEREPYIAEGTDWFVRGLYTAEDIAVGTGAFVPSMIHLGRWVWQQLLDSGFDRVDTLYSSDENVHIDEDVVRVLRNGRSSVFSRGWVQGVYNEQQNSVVQVGRKNPFTVAVTCLSFTIHEKFFRYTTRNSCTGPIVDCAVNGYTHSKTNNSLLGGTVLAMTDFSIPHAGLIQNYSKVQLYSDNRFELANGVEENIALYRLMGDPSTQIFTQRPIGLTVEIPETVSLGTRGISVHVTSEGHSVSDAWVTLSQGNDIHLVCQPGEDAWARFTFDSDELVEGDIDVCITRPNTLPFLGVIRVVGSGIGMDVSFANQDGLFSFGETIRTTLTVQNNTGRALNNIAARLSSESQTVTLPAEIAVGNLAVGGQRQLPFDLTISRLAKGGENIRVQIDFAAGQDSWEHSFIFPASGPSLAVINNPIVDHSFNPEQVAEFAPDIFNNGDLASPIIDATLVVLSPYIEVLESSARYNAVNSLSSRTPQANFRVRAGQLAIPGDFARFMLILDAADQRDAFTDTLYLESMIGDPSLNDPFGPDDYGYIIFDSGDEGWADKCPTYEWIEINPFKQGFDFQGTELELDDEAVDMDCSVVADLPFAFQFYGENFNQIAVCSNGWFAFGAEQVLFPDFRNQQIPGIQGPNAMVAVFWQDFINPFPDERGVFTYYDQNTGRYIIEWSELKLYSDGLDDDVNANLFEFQAILHDPSVYPTTTGDGEIKIQYKKVYIIQGDGTDNLYSTTGIKNLDGTDGLEYCYWNQYPPNNRRMQDELALYITTDRQTSLGRLEGRVTDFAQQNQGLAGVQVRSLRTNVRTTTNAQGDFIIDPIPAGEQDIEFRLAGFNTLVRTVTIENDQTQRLNVSMTHPVLYLPAQSINKSVQPSYSTTFPFEVRNQGNGPLDYRLTRRYINGEDTQYRQTDEWDASSGTGDYYLYGCEIIGDSIYVSGGRDRRDPDDNTMYVFDRQYQLIRQFAQPSITVTGFRDLAYDGELLYGGQVPLIGEQNVLQIVAFNLQGESQRVINLDITYAQLTDLWALAYDPAEEVLYVGNQDKDIFVIDLDGHVVRRITVNIPNYYMNLRGLAWFPEDNEGMKLYLIDQPGNSGIRLSKINPQTGRGRVLHNFQLRDSEKPTGLGIGYNWERSNVSVAFIGDIGGNNVNDFIHVIEIGPDTHYLTIQPAEATVNPGARMNSMITMNGSDLTVGDYEFGLLLEHNATGGSVLIPAHLSVNDTTSIDRNSEEVPTAFELCDAYPNPFNGATRIEFAVPASGLVQLSVYDLSGRLVTSLVNESLDAGRHEVTFRAEQLASGIYFYRLKTEDNVAVKRLVYLR